MISFTYRLTGSGWALATIANEQSEMKIPADTIDMSADAEISPERQPQPYSFARDKLPKSLSYPLKRSLLDGALHSASVYEAIWYVHYSGHQYGSTVLRAHFHPEQFSGQASGKVMLTVWAVQRHERKTTEEVLVRDGLPQLCRWLANAKTEGNAWRGFVHIIDFQVFGTSIRLVEPQA